MSFVFTIGLDKQNFSTQTCKYFFTHNFYHMFWILKRPFQYGSFEYTTTYVLVEKLDLDIFFCYSGLTKSLFTLKA